MEGMAMLREPCFEVYAVMLLILKVSTVESNVAVRREMLGVGTLNAGPSGSKDNLWQDAYVAREADTGLRCNPHPSWINYFYIKILQYLDEHYVIQVSL
jgi:hypothetical protein